MSLNYSYYPGCALHGTAREYESSIAAVCQAIDIQLHEVEDWNCCGATSAHVLDHDLAIGLGARNLEQAQAAGRDVVAPCASCFNRLKTSRHAVLKEDWKYPDGRTPDISIDVLRLSDILAAGVNRRRLEDLVKKRLTGLKVVTYYGCLSMRPQQITEAPRPEDPITMDLILSSLGATVRAWSHKTDCCGGSMTLTRLDLVSRLMRNLLTAATEAGADCFVVDCPMCQANLDAREGGILDDQGKPFELPVLYVTELIGLALDLPGNDTWWRRHIVDPRPLLSGLGLARATVAA